MLHLDPPSVTVVQQELLTRAKFLHVPPWQTPQFITHHYRNQALNANQCTNPDSNSYGPTMVRSFHYITITTAEAWRGLAPGCVHSFVCVCVCGLSSAHILPHQRGHLGDTHPFLSHLPICLHPITFILRSHQRQGYDVCCVTGGHHSLSSCIFFSQLHSSVQTVSYRHWTWFGVSKPGRYLTCSHKCSKRYLRWRLVKASLTFAFVTNQ